MDTLKLINDRLDRMEKKLDSAMRFKYVSIGVVIATSTICGSIITLIKLMGG